MASDIGRLVAQGHECFKRGQLAEGIEAFEAVTRAAPDHWEAHYYLGWAYAHQGELQRAAESYGQAVALQPNSADAFHGRGWTLGQLGHYEHAVTAIRRAIALNPAVALFHRDLGVNLDRVGRREEAVAALQEAIRLDPALPHAYQNLGAVLLDQKRFHEAHDAFAHFCRAEADNADAWWGLARALKGLGQLFDAQRALQRAVALRPEDASLHHELGEVLEKQRHWAFALYEYREAARLDSTSASSAYYADDVARTYLELGAIDDALAWFERASSLAPENARFVFNIGLAHRYAHRERDAELSFRRALTLDPSHADARQQLAFTLLNQQKAEQALALADEGVALDPTSAAAHAARGEVFFYADKPEEAVAALRRALDLDADILKEFPEMNLFYQDSLAALQSTGVPPKSGSDLG